MEKKDIIYKYAELLRKMMSDNDYVLSDEDRELVNYIRNLMKNDDKYDKLIRKMQDLSFNYDQLIKYLDNYYDANQNNENKEQEEKTQEEKIAEVFGVSVGNIEHLYLNSGKEVFHFYSESLGRDVVLENSRNGQKLEDVLKELQDEDKQDDLMSDNDEKSDSLLMENGTRNNLELKMYYPEQIMNNEDILNSLNENDLRLVMFIISKAQEYNIMLINIENMFFITNDHKIKEFSLDNELNPVVSDPYAEAGIDDGYTSDDSVEKTEMDEMFDEEEKEKEKENDEEKENSHESNKVMVLKNDDLNSDGFANNYFFILSVIVIIVIFVVVVLIMR